MEKADLAAARHKDTEGVHLVNAILARVDEPRHVRLVDGAKVGAQPEAGEGKDAAGEEDDAPSLVSYELGDQKGDLHEDRLVAGDVARRLHQVGEQTWRVGWARGRQMSGTAVAI